jgi:hypothetical protein
MLTEQKLLDDPDFKRDAPPILHKLRIYLMGKMGADAKRIKNVAELGRRVQLLSEIDETFERLMAGCLGKGDTNKPQRPRLRTTPDQ